MASGQDYAYSPAMPNTQGEARMGTSREELDKKVVLLSMQKNSGIDVSKELKKTLKKYKSEEDKQHLRSMLQVLGLPNPGV